MLFTPRILKNASRQLKKLDPPVASRIIDQIQWLAEHFEEITKPLHKEKLILVHEIGHRSEIYKKTKP